MSLLFPSQPSALLTPPPAWSSSSPSSCCLVKPHALARAGAIVAALQEEGFTLLGLQTFLLTFSQAEEFLEVYKGVVEEYGEMV